VRPCNLKHQQSDLTPVLRRPVEPAGEDRKVVSDDQNAAIDPLQKSGHQSFCDAQRCLGGVIRYASSA
jgi:hypothetical protein